MLVSSSLYMGLNITRESFRFDVSNVSEENSITSRCKSRDVLMFGAGIVLGAFIVNKRN